jgi:hypothetical protein
MSREIDLSATAATDPGDSVAEERAAVGEHPDTGGLVPADSSQHAPEPSEETTRPEEGLPATTPSD